MEAAGSRKQRRDLLETVESQSVTIAKYETRLRDLVTAYKGLAKEKEALENSFKAISGTTTTTTTTLDEDPGSKEGEDDHDDDVQFTRSDWSDHGQQLLESRVKMLS